MTIVMKKIILATFIAAAAIMTIGCSANCSKMVVKGYAPDLDGYVYVFDDGRNLLDSVAVVNGEFKYKEEYTGPAIYALSSSPEPGPAKLNAKFFVEPGTVTVSADTDMTGVMRLGFRAVDGQLFASVGGTPTNEAYQALCDDYNITVNNMLGMEDFSADALEEKIDEIVYQAIADNKDNYLGAYLLDRMKYYYSGHEMLAAIDELAEELSETKIVTALRELGEQKSKTDEGEHYIEVVQNDPNGKPVSLSSVVENPKNKYVLLDFWASWCGPCMGEVPYLVKTYAEFHKKGFEIYGVSHDTDGEKWTAAIAANKMDWVHVSDLHRFDNQAAKDYAVMAIPSNFLIDTATGTIIGRNLRGEDVYNTIAELLK